MPKIIFCSECDYYTATGMCLKHKKIKYPAETCDSAKLSSFIKKWQDGEMERKRKTCPFV